MILNIKQTKTNFNMQWEVFAGADSLFALAKSPFTEGKFEIEINNFETNTIEKLYYNPFDKTWGNKLKDLLSFKILSENEKIGHIVGQTKKVGFLKSYPYYEFEYKGSLFYGYEVGFGNKGLYFCIYYGEKLIAIAEKKLTVVNFKDSYTLYLADKSFCQIAIDFVLYYDSVSYGDVMKIALLSVKKNVVNTFQKELIEKFDPEFILKVKAEDEKTKSE